MSKFNLEIGAVDTSLMVAIKDTTGAILETLTAATPGLVCHMAGADEADTSIPLVALASITAAHTDGGFIYRPLQKLYRLDLPDTVSVLGKRTRVVSLYGAALMEPSYSEIEIVSSIETGSDDRVLISADSHAAGPVLADKAGFTISGTKQTLDALNDLTAAAVNAEVDTALADVNLDHIAGTATGIPAISAGTYLDQMMDDGTATYDRTTDSLQALADSGGGGLTAQQVRDAMKLAPTGGAPGAGSVDEHLDDVLANTGELQSNQGNWITATGFNTVVPDAAGVAPTATAIRQEIDANSTKLDVAVSTRNAIAPDNAGVASNATEIAATIVHLLDIKGTGFVKDTHSLPQCLTGAGGSSPTVEEIRAEIDTNSTKLDVAVSTRNSIAPNTVTPVTIAQLTAAFTEIKGSTWTTTDTLEAIRDAVGAIPTVTPDPAGTLATPAQVLTQVNDALVALHLDHLLAVDYDPDSQPGVGTALLNELVESDVGVSRFTANALENAPSGGGGSGLTAQQIRDSMKLSPTGGAPDAGSVDDYLGNINTNTAGLGGDGMRGTDGANTEVPDAAGTAATLISAHDDSVGIQLASIEATIVARTPTGAELAYIVAHAKTAKPVTFASGTTTTAVFDTIDGAPASSVDDYYNGRILVFNAGTLDMQVTDITGYVGSTLTATITGITTAITSSHTAVLV